MIILGFCDILSRKELVNPITQRTKGLEYDEKQLCKAFFASGSSGWADIWLWKAGGSERAGDCSGAGSGRAWNNEGTGRRRENGEEAEAATELELQTQEIVLEKGSREILFR